ncbi:16S rRNA (uracil(1498)-N(3))-methyltransferase [Oceaniglobus ichthyenteri]|uniref:16S rRNA (uracil(1498)-N(3))-methyltransferase n=1 Tax=Oceaniglobus ichthyenteri TaxID=2136177 RepID=UPI000D3D4751|nr:16S rRNA (uracil(1498)-N(3))-methyltransferase [Oceaniglobus ichthyenteri]
MAANIRLYLDQEYAPGQSCALTQAQSHYLFGVMRLDVNAAVTVFNGRDGAWLAQVAKADRRKGVLTLIEQSAPLITPPDLWLLFAPIKKARTDFIVEKAAELGAARIMPVQTDFTNAERVRQDRLQAHAIEAAEQCGATFVPPVDDLVRLDRVLADWPKDRHLMFCDETRLGAATSLAGAPRGPWAVLIGPEGGFSPAEHARLSAHPMAHPVSLGPRILRADTAAVAALTLWQSALGDWA